MLMAGGPSPRSRSVRFSSAGFSADPGLVFLLPPFVRIKSALIRPTFILKYSFFSPPSSTSTSTPKKNVDYIRMSKDQTERETDGCAMIHINPRLNLNM